MHAQTVGLRRVDGRNNIGLIAEHQRQNTTRMRHLRG